MLIRDLAFVPGASKYWEHFRISLLCGRQLWIDHPTAENHVRSRDFYFIKLTADHPPRVIALHELLEEFEAQAVLDYYLQTHNPER